MGETFGEEALISGATRNATITMLTDGVLMRLAKDDFNTLLNEPMLQWVDHEQGLQIVAKGGMWLDVRLPSEYEHWHLEPSLNVPLYFIRLKIKTLDPTVPYVVVCDNGRRSSAAAYILSERGFEAHVLRGGIAATDLADTLIRERHERALTVARGRSQARPSALLADRVALLLAGEFLPQSVLLTHGFFVLRLRSCRLRSGSANRAEWSCGRARSHRRPPCSCSQVGRLGHRRSGFGCLGRRGCRSRSCLGGCGRGGGRRLDRSRCRFGRRRRQTERERGKHGQQSHRSIHWHLHTGSRRQRRSCRRKPLRLIQRLPYVTTSCASACRRPARRRGRPRSCAGCCRGPAR